MLYFNSWITFECPALAWYGQAFLPPISTALLRQPLNWIFMYTHEILVSNSNKNTIIVAEDFHVHSKLSYDQGELPM